MENFRSLTSNFQLPTSRYLYAMIIGFDAKRAFHNGTGLGHYSRSLVRYLSQLYPGHTYYLFNARKSKRFSLQQDNLQEVLPAGFFDKLFPALWRAGGVITDCKKLGIELYHGLSHEIPYRIQHTGIRTVVTIHDLIHERYPQQYNAISRRIYTRKFRYACRHADKVIAISEQTKKDIVEMYKTPAEKITVCYQGCNPAFGEKVSDEEKQRVRALYRLPEEYFLYVGSVIWRKNLLNICKAILALKDKATIPLVAIGRGLAYFDQVKDFIKENGLEKKIILLSETPGAKSSEAFQTARDFPAIYQSATAMIYPSRFEGFGIPVLEAMWSRLPVITAPNSSLEEVGGDAVYYADPESPAAIGEAMMRISSEPALAGSLAEKGWQRAQRFSIPAAAEAVMNVYKKLVE